MSHRGDLFEYVGGSRDGQNVQATVEPPFHIRLPREGGTYRTGVLITNGKADDHVLVWDQDGEYPPADPDQ